MKKTILLIIAIVLAITISAQEDKKSDFWKNVQFGGGITIAFDNNTTNLGLAPSALYNFNDNFSLGFATSYLYSKNKNIDKALNVYGGSLISIYNPINEIQLSAEFEENIINQSGFDSRNVEAFFLGFGYNVGRNIAIGVRYDVLYDKDKSVYGSALSPIVRVYF